MKRKYGKLVFSYSKYIKKNELNLLCIKAISCDLRLVNVIRFFFFKFMFDLKRTKINYFCVETNQIRGSVPFFNTFRMNFRDNALFARYSGVKKKSW